MTDNVNVSVKNTNNKISISTNHVDTNITVGVDDVNSKVTTSASSPSFWIDLAKDWAIQMNGLVSNTDYSSKFYAEQAKTNAETTTLNLAEVNSATAQVIEYLRQAQAAAEQTEIIAANVSVGLTFVSFSENDWIENDGLYTLTLDIPVAVGVYNEQRQLIFNIDIQCVDNQTVLTALEAFDGYVLCTANSDTENEDNNEFTKEELEDLIVDTWEDIDTNEP